MTERMSFDPYATLGVTRGASALQVARAHRRLAKRFHPDLHPNEAGTERMRRINDAWRILSTPAHREAWDREHPVGGIPMSHWGPTADVAAGDKGGCEQHDAESQHPAEWRPGWFTLASATRRGVGAVSLQSVIVRRGRARRGRRARTATHECRNRRHAGPRLGCLPLAALRGRGCRCRR